MSFTKTKLLKLHDKLEKMPSQNRPNLILVKNNQILFCYKKRLNFSEYAKGYGFVEHMRPERGDIMDFFADIELIVSQIIISHIAKEKTNETEIDQLLDLIDLFSKVKLLRDWGLINGSVQGELICIKEVRNGFAHRWNLEDINYKGKPVLANFSKFKSDSLNVFNVLAKLYNGGEVDVDKLLKNIK